MTKILIADDEPNILQLTCALFQDTGMDVVCATNGQEAIALAKEQKPDLIITDVIMPKKDGFEVCRTVRDTPEIADIPIIILSAMGDEFNKLTGFEGGADDYVTKPFNVDELKARVSVLLNRYQRRTGNSSSPTEKPKPEETDQPTMSTGISVLDDSLSGGFPLGSNILVLGETGRGKSSFSRKFISHGLREGERCLFVAIDDSPKRIRQQLDQDLDASAQEFEQLGLLRFVDGYSWSSYETPAEEAFAVSGMLELNQLSGVIADAGFELGQTIQNKLGGRRVIDSISSLLVNFELPAVQRFINQIARTSLAFGGVVTLFILEKGTVSEQVLNNIKYIMDGVIEFGEDDQHKRVVRVASMKWAQYDNGWKPVS